MRKWNRPDNAATVASYPQNFRLQAIRKRVIERTKSGISMVLENI